ncbi:type II toxin-antitoxin system RelE/ParE family toxin [Nitrosospira multiformis]|uniref:type II toxin-antitoxin system RelE/ParE family toxin n=1 Tax=Nitrosospira multiformis TaxID=1231 RepID=UPI00089A40AB|nr:type II toxin-antitoxin system RelE/ParE family toxin [Nitrosospira multiformis]SEA62366.1 toxin ParE1/3/4 [Nitrosospira multiformis]
MPAIYKRPLAREDLIEIWEYIADDSIDRADAFIDIIDGKLRTLAAQPMMGRARDELMAGLRSFPVGRYILFYELVTDGIALVRVLHSARDIPSQFESE